MIQILLKIILAVATAAALACGAGQCASDLSKCEAAEVSVKEIAESLIKEEAIKQALKDNYTAFVQTAKVTAWGRTVYLSMSVKDKNILYTMSIRENKYGIVSVDFTKQITVKKDIVDIYYEGVRGNGYYCYAKQLRKQENCKQIALSTSSIFEQVIVMLFQEGETV